MAFDSNIDYMSMLKDSELHDGEYPLLRGLQRLAHSDIREGVQSISSKICAVPGDNKVAAVTVHVGFKDGTMFCGSADATDKAHKKPYSNHLVAVADAKAESRALRRAFNITKVTFEEIGTSDVAGDPDGGQITPHQIEAIKKTAKRKKLSQAYVLERIKCSDVTDIKQLTAAQGRAAMKAINKAKVKND